MDYYSMKRLTKITSALGLGLALFMSPPVWADEDSDKAFRAVREGKIAPLSEIMDIVLKTYGGQILGVELEEKKFDEMGLPIEGTAGSQPVRDINNLPSNVVLYYEIKLLTPQGNILKIKYNAHTSGLLKVQGRPKDQQQGPEDYELDDFQEYDDQEGGDD